jgi:cold shock CspA family protein
MPKLMKSRALDAYCEKLFDALREPRFEQHIKAVLDVFDSAFNAWTGRGGSRFGIKDNREFTDLLLQHAQQRFARAPIPKTRDDERNTCEGTVLRIVWKHGLWFGFIKRGSALENVYFDSRGYDGAPEALTPERRVRFEISKSDRGLYARHVTFADVQDAPAPSPAALA